VAEVEVGALVTWARHPGSTAFCYVASSTPGHSTITLCRGRWSAEDEDEVEVATEPAADDRCDACWRAVVEQGRAEFARLWESELASFEASLPEPQPAWTWRPSDYDWPGVYELEE
jgi:hypothetical protein